MKKLFLSTLFGLMAFLSTAQLTVYNSSGDDLVVGVQYTLATTSGCSIDATDMQNIIDGSNFTFTIPAGYSVLKVGVSGMSSDDEYSPCASCSGAPATAYTFNWSGSCLDLNVLP